MSIAQRAHARADRAGGDQHDFAAGLALRGDLRHQLLHLGQVRLLPAVGQDAGAQLDHDAGDVFQKFRTHKQLGNKPSVPYQTTNARLIARSAPNRARFMGVGRRGAGAALVCACNCNPLPLQEEP